MLRREFSGGVIRTLLAANVTISANTLTAIDGSTFPSGLSNPFIIVAGRTTLREEKILISSRSGNVFTVATNGRGYDGSVASTHNTTEFIDHALDASSIQDMNTTTYDNEILIAMGV